MKQLKIYGYAILVIVLAIVVFCTGNLFGDTIKRFLLNKKKQKIQFEIDGHTEKIKKIDEEIINGKMKANITEERIKDLEEKRKALKDKLDNKQKSADELVDDFNKILG